MSATSSYYQLCEQIENNLLEDLRQKQLAWIRASEADRDLLRQQFMNALQVFNSLVLDRKLPDGANQHQQQRNTNREP